MNVFRSFRISPLKSHVLSKRYLSFKPEDVDQLSKTTWDVIISGGGMVGCAIAASMGMLKFI